MARVQAISDFAEDFQEDPQVDPMERLRSFVDTEPQVVVKRVMPDREILAAMTGLGSLLAVRLILALSVVGAFSLAYIAITSPSPNGLFVLLAYAVTVIFPLVYLSAKRV